MTRRSLQAFSCIRLALAVALAAATGGCRSCSEDRGAPADAAPAGPTMPVGMLMPVDAAGTETGGTMRVARGMKGGAWTELQVAKSGDRPDRSDFKHWLDDSSFVSLAAMTLMHEAFARALPGFDLFLPRLFGPEALVKLDAELEAFAQRSTGEIAGTARELALFARQTAAKGQSLWVLGP